MEDLFMVVWVWLELGVGVTLCTILSTGNSKRYKFSDLVLMTALWPKWVVVKPKGGE